jgi:hypothetical protein
MKNEARFDHATAIMEGLFKPIGTNQVAKLKALAPIEYPPCTYSAKETDGRVIKRGFTITIKTPATVGVNHETLLLTLLKMAVRDERLTKESNKELKLNFTDLTKERLLIKTSYPKLIRELGLEWSGPAKKRIKGYLKDFVSSTVEVQYHLTNQEIMDNMLGYAENVGGVELAIALNARLTACYLGEQKYVTINLDERQALSKDVAKSLHRWLSTNLIKKGIEQGYFLETLATKIWGKEFNKEPKPRGAETEPRKAETKEDTQTRKREADTKRKRLEYVKEALQEINALATGKWSCRPDATTAGKWSVKRAK